MKGQERERSFLNGNRVYRGTSHSPDSGRKDPSGYIKRENHSSDKRSGLASAALNLRDRITGGGEGGAQMQQPFIPMPLVPVGPGLMKDRRGRIYNAGPLAQAQAQATAPTPPSESAPPPPA